MTNYFDIARVSNSLLGQVMAEALGQPPLNQRSPALRYGKHAHELILEPEKYDFRQYSGKERMEMMKMKKSFMDVAWDLLEGDKEVELMYSFRGYECKMKADIINQPAGIITDLKSTAKTNLEDFQASALEYSYHRQAAWYLDAPPVRDMGINTFRIIAVNKVSPYPVFVWEMYINHPMIEAGRQEYLDVLDYMNSKSKFSHLKSAVKAEQRQSAL